MCETTTLPTELLRNCLQVSDFKTLIKSCHICIHILNHISQGASTRVSSKIPEIPTLKPTGGNSSAVGSCS